MILGLLVVGDYLDTFFVDLHIISLNSTPGDFLSSDIILFTCSFILFGVTLYISKLVSEDDLPLFIFNDSLLTDISFSMLSRIIWDLQLNFVLADFLYLPS